MSGKKFLGELKKSAAVRAVAVVWGGILLTIGGSIEAQKWDRP
ncbi:hypothetical protein [Desulfovibrio gilichinskyi]|uniref:Uncharacterized protein n=1 Tax=Desulfovibrio gilichinskyi TaxID=1519643 RepID=A0A1X7F111_9BACT|nr:hypothetical protein [Desulfovibrio gilichinskyi]SMF44021.1 hypothetical protein SAMN06295933_3563 [Desulfovibrio gilichinskyi]